MALAALFGLLAGPQVVVYAAGVSIDGSFSDWTGKDTFTDRNGADDSNPKDTDVTEYRADADSGGIYLLMAWDDTSFNNASHVGVTVRSATNAYYRIYSMANSGTPPVAASTLSIYSCANETCNTQTLVCEDVSGTGACTGAGLASGTTWADPFATRTTPSCNGTDCGTLDPAAEMYIPWSWLGGAPGNNEMFFMQYGSYASAGGTNAKDSVAGTNGITCTLTGGVYDCYPSDPTAVNLVSFSARSAPAVSGWPALLVALLAVLAWGLWKRSVRRRAA